MITQYLLYLLRWQLSTPVLAPIVAVIKGSSVLGSPEDWIAVAIANLIGGLIFFWVDKFIFTSNKIPTTIWEVQNKSRCADCNKKTRGYRLVKDKNYDKTKDKNPEFRCEKHSIKKMKSLTKYAK